MSTSSRISIQTQDFNYKFLLLVSDEGKPRTIQETLQIFERFRWKNTAAVSPAITRINFIFTIKERSEIDIAVTASRFTRQPQNGKSI